MLHLPQLCHTWVLVMSLFDNKKKNINTKIYTKETKQTERWNKKLLFVLENDSNSK
jgi:hypothetical protein